MDTNRYTGFICTPTGDNHHHLFTDLSKDFDKDSIRLHVDKVLNVAKPKFIPKHIVCHGLTNRLRHVGVIADTIRALRYDLHSDKEVHVDLKPLLECMYEDTDYEKVLKPLLPVFSGMKQLVITPNCFDGHPTLIEDLVSATDASLITWTKEDGFVKTSKLWLMQRKSRVPKAKAKTTAINLVHTLAAEVYSIGMRKGWDDVTLCTMFRSMISRYYIPNRLVSNDIVLEGVVRLSELKENMVKKGIEAAWEYYLSKMTVLSPFFVDELLTDSSNCDLGDYLDRLITLQECNSLPQRVRAVASGLIAFVPSRRYLICRRNIDVLDRILSLVHESSDVSKKILNRWATSPLAFDMNF